MANPNIVNVATINAGTSLTALTSTSATSIVSNAAASGKVYKVNCLYVTNVDGTSAADITINIYPQAALAGTPVPIAYTISVPADATLIVIAKDAPIYLTENMSIGATAAVANDLSIVASWEEIS